jgi:putative ABC transport system permease protein
MRGERWIYKLPLRWRSLFRRKRVDEELEEELRDHVERKTEESIAKGMSADEARRAAMVELRGLERTKEECKDVMPLRWLDHLWRDLRFGTRLLVKNPGFTIIAVIALALGIGADTAMYTIVNGALSWDMGVDNRDEIVAITATNATRSEEWETSYADFRDYRAQTKSLAGLAAYVMNPANVSDKGELPERYNCVQMSANGFSVVQQKPLFGRDFVAADEKPGATPVVMLGYHVWRDRYGSDPGIIGKTITMDEVPRVVIGVMPPGRRFPEETDLWTPLVQDAAEGKRDNRNLMVFGRLRPGVSVAAVQAEFTTLASSLAREYPKTNEGVTAQVQPILMLTGLFYMKPLFLVLFGAVGFVLLIACADVANMLLARAAGRTREISIRVAIGAGKISILRQLLVESVVLSLAGGFFGWLVALAGLRWFDRGLHSIPKPVWLHLSLDRGALFYLMAISIGTGILFGLAPALRLAKADVNAALKEGGGSGVAGSKFGTRLSNALVALQMALCVMLLAAAGLMIRSAVKLYGAPVGVNTSNLLTMRVNLPEAKYRTPESWIAFHKELEKRLNATPGVEMMGLASNLPLTSWLDFDLDLEDKNFDPSQRPEIGALIVSDNYFQLMQVQPRRGRVFKDTDGEAGTPVALVNETFAEKFWPGQDALGKRLRLVHDGTSGAWMTVAGIVPDILQNFRNNLEHDALVYVPFAENPQRQMSVVARTKVPPASLADAFRRVVQGMDSNLPLYDMRTLEDRIAESRLTVSLFGAICSVFAAIATLLAAVGLYGVMAHAVSQRTQEIGLRMALGAKPSDISRLVVAQCFGPLAVGMAMGMLLALGATRLLHVILVGVSPSDPLTFAGTLVVLACAAMLGCVVPARRAMRVDPMIALRYE